MTQSANCRNSGGHKYSYVIVDECSMVSHKFISELERNIGTGKGSPQNGPTFSGGFNAILCGDC